MLDYVMICQTSFWVPINELKPFVLLYYSQNAQTNPKVKSTFDCHFLVILLMDSFSRTMKNHQSFHKNHQASLFFKPQIPRIFTQITASQEYPNTHSSPSPTSSLQSLQKSARPELPSAPHSPPTTAAPSAPHVIHLPPLITSTILHFPNFWNDDNLKQSSLQSLFFNSLCKFYGVNWKFWGQNDSRHFELFRQIAQSH
jgi:hypothetical protein